MTDTLPTEVLPKEGSKEIPRWQALLEKASLALRTGEVITAPHYDFYPLPNQPRSYFGPEAMKRMTESIKGPLGQVYEGVARKAPPGSPAPYQIIDGERRWRGCRGAGVPYRARIIDIDDEAIPYILAAIANFNREGHSVPEIVNTTHHFLELGMPWDEIARMIGATVTWTQKLYTLKRLRIEVWDMLDPSRVKSQILPTMAALEIAMAHPATQLALAKKVLEHKLTVAAVKDEVGKAARVLGQPHARQKRAPRKTWQSIYNRAGVLTRTSTDLRAVLDDETMAEILQGRPDGQVLNVLQQMQETRKRLEECETMIMKKCPPRRPQEATPPAVEPAATQMEAE